MPDFLQDMKLKLDPAFMPPESAASPVGPVVPPLRLGPPPATGAAGGFDPLAPVPLSTLLPPPTEGAPPDLFSHYADADKPPDAAQAAMGAVSGAVQGLGNGPGVQIDKKGIGATLDDWKLRFMPYIPFLNEP